MALDLNRGVTMRFHPTGMKIAMYDDTPGIYMTEDGKQIDSKLAREAHFDVDRDTRVRLKNEKLAQYRAQLEAEMRSEEESLAQLASSKGEYDVRHVGAGRYAVFDKSGKRIGRSDMTRQDVELLVGPLPADLNDPTAPAPSA